MRVAEVDGHVQRGADPFVQGEVRSLVPGQAVAQEFGQVLHLVDDGLLDVFGVVPVGQVQQDREPGGALDERADGAFVAAAGDEIALPVARDRPVLDLRGSLRDHGHGFAETGFAALAALGSAGGSPLPHGAFQLLLEFAPGLQVDGLVDRLDARVHIPIIREVQPQPVGYLLRAPMPAQPGGDLVPQSRALGRLARFGAFEPVRGLLLGAVRLVTAGLGIPVALDLAADRAGVAAQQAGDGADRIAQTQTVRDLDALLLAQVARMEGLGFVHGGTIPVHQGFLVPSRGARPAVAPRLAGAFRDADRVRGLGEVHAFLVQQAHVLGASRLAHQLPRRIFDAVERPTVFPATVFVSVASGHLTLLAVGQVLQRSLEPAYVDAYGWDVPDSQTELYRVDSNGKLGSGDLYALPNSYSVTGIYFNTKLAEQLGIDAAPTSVEEFEADMQTAKDAGILPMMTYAKDGGTSFVFQALMANNSSAEDVQNWILQKSGTFDNQAAQDAASTLQDWNNKGYMPEGVNAVDASTALSRFCNGEGLFFPSGNWNLDTVAKALGDDVQFFAFPGATSEDEPNVAANAGAFYGIPVNAKNRDAAAAFLDYTQSAEAQQIIVDNSGYLPKSSTLDLKANSALQQSMFDAYADVLTSGHTSDFINNATAGMQSSGLIPNFQLLLDNSITPQEFTKNVQAQYDKEAKR